MKEYRVNEIFYSLQGEGAFTGTPAVFLRFSGCNRCCSFCDTDFDTFSVMTCPSIVEKVSRYPARHIVLTGGEPLLQADAQLISALHEAGFFIHVETNGTIDVPPGIDWVTCSPKDNLPVIDPAKVNELKIVYTGQSALELARIRHIFNGVALCYLQPCSGLNTAETVECVLANCEWRLSLQTHKLIDIK